MTGLQKIFLSFDMVDFRQNKTKKSISYFNENIFIFHKIVV